MRNFRHDTRAGRRKRSSCEGADYIKNTKSFLADDFFAMETLLGACTHAPAAVASPYAIVTYYR
jgi:hypothetical protein